METPRPEVTDYVCGFMFSHRFNEVALILKEKGPAEVIGKWNGIGGKIEERDKEQALFEPWNAHRFERGIWDSYAQVAMSREFREEAGLVTSPQDWKLVASHAIRPDPIKAVVTATVTFFACQCPSGREYAVHTKETEKVAWKHVSEIWHLAQTGQLAPNVGWLIPAALHLRMSKPIRFGG